MLSSLAYTPFPNLHTSATAQKSCGAEKHIAVRGVNLDENVLLLAWAHLLRGYTQHDVVVFRHNVKSIQVDAQNLEILTVGRDYQLDPRKTCTAVFTNTVSTQDLNPDLSK